ncbi:MAG: DUF481 domain-containing protein [bacterium]|nr:DUF481 domain-containing protein [bacterium]
MHLFRTLAVCAATATFAVAQDRVTLSNGDTITGKIKTMADGVVVVESPVLGDIEVKLSEIENLVSESQVALETVNGETFRRRIAGIENKSLRLDGDIPALAIDSISRMNPPKDPPPSWKGSLSFTGLWMDGNTRRRTVGLIGEAVRRSEIDRVSFDTFWDYAEDKPSGQAWVLNQRRAGAGLKYDYFLNERWYALATTRVLADTFADIDLRFTAGTGIGYTVIDNAQTTLNAEAGLSYLDETYRSAAPSTAYLAARVAYKLTHEINERTRFNHSVEAFPSLEDKRDVYLQCRAELVNNLTDNMIASLAWIMDYDNTPSPGLKRYDHRVMLSIGWSF